MLREALASVLSQDRSLIAEVLIGDDTPDVAGRKAIAEVVAEFDDTLVRLHSNFPPRGTFPNHWDLADRAGAEFICFLHSDDRLLPGALRTLVEAVANEPDCIIWFGDVEVIDESGEIDLRLTAAAKATYKRGNRRGRKPIWEWCLNQSIPPDGYLVRRADYLAHCRGSRDGNVGDFRFEVRLANAGGGRVVRRVKNRSIPGTR